MKKKLKIDDGEYKSLFSGVTDIKFKPLNEAPESMTFYFFGEEESIWNIKRNIGFNAGRLKIEKEKNEMWISVCAWLVFGLLLMLLTVFDIQFQKKESLVMLSLGKSTLSIMLKNIFTDITVLFSLTVALCLILNKFTYLFYNKNITVTLFTLVILLNSLVYLLMLKYDLKAAFSKAIFTKSVLTDCYILKAVSLVLTLLVLSANIFIISENGRLLNKRDTIAQFKDYCFVNVYSENHYETNSKTEQLIDNVKKDIIFKESLNNDTAFSVIGISGLQKDYLLINKNAISLLKGIKELEYIDFTKDYYIFVPETYENTNESIEVINKDLINRTEGLQYDMIAYSSNKNILYFKENTCVDTVVNFDLSDSPVIFFLNSNDKKLLNITNADVLFGNMMFKFSEKDKAYYEEEYKLTENMIAIKMNNVVQKTHYSWSVLGRMVGLSTVLSLFMLFLELIMIITVSKLEHITNAMEISLKKVMGYSVIKRNRRIFVLNAVSVSIGIIAAVIMGLLLESSIVFMAFALGIIIFILEYIVVFYYVTRLENTSIPKILKGGCL